VVQAPTRLDDLPLPRWSSLGVLAADALGALALGGLLLQRREAEAARRLRRMTALAGTA
jgi:hypothetical protein